MIKKASIWSAGFGLATIVVAVLFGSYQTWGVAAGYWLSAFFVIPSLFVTDRFFGSGNKAFLTSFYISLVGRFAIVLVSFGLIIVFTEIDKNYFTASFFISYLSHSVTEMILLNKILHRSSSSSQ